MSQEDTSIRPNLPPAPHLTEDERLLTAPRQAEFTHGDPWRVLRIMSEFVEGFDRLTDVYPAVTIFGSARTRPDHPDYQSAVETARRLGEAGLNIITGGGPGIMQAGNEGARQAGVLSIGLNIELPFEQGVNPHVDLALQFRYFFARKTMFVKYALGYVVFPGGYGTMDELFEALTLIQTGKIKNFPVVLFGQAYWQGLLDWLRAAALTTGKIAAGDLDLVLVTDSPATACEHIVRAIQDSSWREAQETAAREAERLARTRAAADA